MNVQIERRSHGQPRMPVDLLVELSSEGDVDVFEADAVDLGPGGIGLRASVLPEVGQRLRCRFEVPGSDELCEAAGEVVWAHDAGQWSGAFGVRFEGMDARTAAVLDDIVPPPVEDPGTPEELRAPRTVKVRLDGVGSAIDGEIVSDGATLTIEQSMPFLQIGRGAEVEHDATKVRAVLERVRLRVENGTPRLVLELSPEAVAPEVVAPEVVAPEVAVPAVDDESFEDEASFGADADATMQDEDLESILARARAAEERAYEKGKLTRPQLRAEEPVAEREDDLEAHGADARDDAAAFDAEAAAPRRALVSRDAERAGEMRKAREVPRVVTPSEDALDAEEAPLVRKARAFAEAARPRLASATASVRAAGVALARKSGPLALRARDAIRTAWRALVARVAARSPRLGAMARKAPKRRTTAAPAAPRAATPVRRARSVQVESETPRAGVRGLVIGAIAVAAVGLAAYGFASRPAEPTPIELSPAPSVESPAPTLAAPVTVPETLEPVEPPSAAASPAAAAPAPTWDRAMPDPVNAAGPMPAPSYPSLAARRADAPAAAPAPIAPSGGSLQFGAEQVEGGRTTSLRMSAAVQSLEGQADGGGFTITIRGALSLDRAAPLAAASSSIERASIINRGDHSVLTIRFVTGRTPAYRVVANGTSLDVTIGR